MAEPLKLDRKRGVSAATRVAECTKFFDRSYKLSGEWDLLGDVRSDGAGGTACTVLPQVQFRVAA
jgi:hypothetical protein